MLYPYVCVPCQNSTSTVLFMLKCIINLPQDKTILVQSDKFPGFQSQSIRYLGLIQPFLNPQVTSSLEQQQQGWIFIVQSSSSRVGYSQFRAVVVGLDIRSLEQQQQGWIFVVQSSSNRVGYSQFRALVVGLDIRSLEQQQQGWIFVVESSSSSVGYLQFRAVVVVGMDIRSSEQQQQGWIFVVESSSCRVGYLQLRVVVVWLDICS